MTKILKINHTFFINQVINYLLNFVYLNFHKTLRCLSIVSFCMTGYINST